MPSYAAKRHVCRRSFYHISIREARACCATLASALRSAVVLYTIKCHAIRANLKHTWYKAPHTVSQRRLLRHAAHILPITKGCLLSFYRSDRSSILT